MTRVALWYSDSVIDMQFIHWYEFTYLSALC